MKRHNDNKSTTKGADTKFNIYTETAANIFQLCLEKNDEGSSGTIYSRLFEKIISKFPVDLSAQHHLNSKYLSNLHLKIKQYQADKKLKISIECDYFTPIALFAGIENVEKYDREYMPVTSTPLLYTPYPFGLFSLARLPKIATVFDSPDELKFSAGGNNEGGNVTEVDPFTMPGDRYPFWVCVIYLAKDGKRQAYFAENEFFKRPISENSRIYLFFRKLSKKI